jgi:phage terminase large subunit-like protein
MSTAPPDNVAGYDPTKDADGFYYDHDEAQWRVDFFAECLTLTSGEWAGQPFALAPWQEPIVRTLFGWKRDDGTRRYRTLFLFVPRKNGKTELAAGMLGSVCFQDTEPGVDRPRHQMYSAAVDREQASLVFFPLVEMIKAEPVLASRCEIYEKQNRSIVFGDTGNVFRVLTGERKGKHGMNTHCYTMDELHEQQDERLLEALNTSMGAQRQPLRLYMTTADYAGPSICNDEMDYAIAVRDGATFDPTYLPVIYAADKDEDWTDPAVWAKANPGYPVSPKHDYLAEMCRKAQQNPREENSFKRLHLDIQTEQSERWLSMEAWGECGEPVEIPDGEPCHGGLDLSSTEDITAAVLYFPRLRAVHWRFYLPEARIESRRHNAEQYRQWVNQGLLTSTPGNAIDHDYILADVLELSRRYTIHSVGVDPWNSLQLAVKLNDEGVEAVTYAQGYAQMNEPSKELERLLLERELRHGAHPVATWMARSVHVRRDPSDNIRPVKPERGGSAKIDGIVALIMAIGRAITTADPTSVYQQRGLVDWDADDEDEHGDD